MFLNEFDNFNSGSLEFRWTRFDVSTSSTSSTSLTRTLSEVEVSRMVTSTRFGGSASLNDLNEDTEPHIERSRDEVEVVEVPKKTAHFPGRLTYNIHFKKLYFFD